MEINDQLIEDHGGLVGMCARRLYSAALSKGLTWDDLVQEGYIGLIKAAQRFDPTKGFAFSTYGAALVRGQMLLALRSYSSIHVPRTVTEKPVVVSFDAPLPGTDDFTLENLLGAKPDDYSAIDGLFDFDLSWQERQILALYAAGYSQVEIAGSIGISQAQVSRVYTRIKARYLEQCI